LDNSAFGRYQKRYNAAIVEETANMRCGGALGFNYTMRAVRSAMTEAFLSDEAKEQNVKSFTNTIWSAMKDEEPHVTAGSGLPGLSPVFLDVDSVLAHLLKLRTAAEDGDDIPEEVAGRTDTTRLFSSMQHENARAKASANENLVTMLDRVSTVPTGAAVDFIDAPGTALHGQKACFCCRRQIEKMNQKNATYAHQGGQLSFEEMELNDDKEAAERLTEERRLTAGREERAAKKAKKASSQAVFEDALEKLVVEMNAAVRLRGGAQRDERIRRLQAVLDGGAAAADGISGAYGKQKEALSEAKTTLQALQAQAKAEEKEAREAQVAAEKEARQTAELEKLQADAESRKAAEGRLLTRLFKARTLEDEKAKEEHAKVIKAMRALFKKEMRQEALEAAL
jgi:hypothetical protein